MTVYDWNRVSLRPAIAGLGEAIRRRWGIWVGFLDADGRVVPLGDGPADVELPVCRRLAANPVTTEAGERHTCADTLREWAESAAEARGPRAEATQCHAGLSARAAPVCLPSSDQPVGAVYASGYLADDGESPADGVRDLMVDNDLAGDLPADAFTSIPRLDERERRRVGILLEEIAEMAGRHLDKPDGGGGQDDAEPSEASEEGRLFEGMVGRDAEMLQMFEDLSTVAATDATVLVQGENGTGKELVARAVHRRSPRSSERFVAVNCSAVPDQLVESELFGHKKGAFSGAHRDRDGLCREADGGTLLLDEIGDMKKPMQAKLLRFLQEGQFSPVGSSKLQSVDVRVICATNQRLEQLVEAGDFRRDLFFRINVVRLDVPPLRRRRDDIPLLIDHFLSRVAKKHGLERPELSEGCRRALVTHDWPGNVRELENEVERLVIMSAGRGAIGREALSGRVGGASEGPTIPATFDDMTLPEATERIERAMILEGLRETGWNKTRTAEKLGVSRRNLIRKVKKFELEQYRPDD